MKRTKRKMVDDGGNSGQIRTMAENEWVGLKER